MNGSLIANYFVCTSFIYPLTGDKCYRLFFRHKNNGLTWTEAVSECKMGPGRNPNIASVHSKAEMGKLVLYAITSITAKLNSPTLYKYVQII